jgi:hypothetical protein
MTWDQEFQNHMQIVSWHYKRKGMVVPLAVKREIKSFAMKEALKAIGAPDSSW